MDPLTIGLGIGAVAGLAQMYQSEQARGANQKELDRIREMFEAIKPPDYDMSITAPPEYHEQALRKPEFAAALAAPKFDMSKFKPEDKKMLQQYVPEVAQYVEEAAPKTIEKTSDMKAGREAQLAALQRLKQIGAGEFDPEYQQAVQTAARRAQGEAQSRQQSILQDFARRGQGGSGLSLAAQLGGAAQAMDRAALVNQQAATDAYRNRMQALMNGAQLGSQISNEDVNTQGRNADILNAYNQRLAGARQAWQNNRANALNGAQQFNINMGQNIANANTDARNQAALGNINRYNELTAQQYDAARGQQSRGDQLAQWGYAQDQNTQNNYNQIQDKKYQNALNSLKYRNELLGRGYEDKLAQVRGAAGLSDAQRSMNTQTAQDRNAGIQGLANAYGSYATAESARNDARKLNKAKYGSAYDDGE